MNYKGKNGIQVTPDIERDVIILKTFVDGRYGTWVEFDIEKADALVDEIKKARHIILQKDIDTLLVKIKELQESK